MKLAIAMLAPALILLSVHSKCSSQTTELSITVKAGKGNYTNVPVCVPVSVPKALAKVRLATVRGEGQSIIAQLTAPGLTTESKQTGAAGLVRRDLHFILPSLKASSTPAFTVTISSDSDAKSDQVFVWENQDGEFSELSIKNGKTNRRILRYMKKKYDTSNPQARNESYKVFHHLYDPSGTRYVTNGGHSDRTIKGKLLYPHHRGLMYGFNNVTYGKGLIADTWHCPVKGKKEAHVEHVKTFSEESGPVLGRHRGLINWYGKDTVFAKEEREVTVYKIPGGTLVEFASRLKTTGGVVKLNGDPQHAGFQFRAHNDVAGKTKNLTYYLRVDGKGKLGGTINWGGKNPPKGTVDIPWKAMSFVLDKQRYTAAYLDHPNNPGEARHSERNYGRFGYYFVYTVTEKNPLLVNYRVWLQDGEMTIPQVSDLHADFTNPPSVSVQIK